MFTLQTNFILKSTLNVIHQATHLKRPLSNISTPLRIGICTEIPFKIITLSILIVCDKLNKGVEIATMCLNMHPRALYLPFSHNLFSAHKMLYIHLFLLNSNTEHLFLFYQIDIIAKFKSNLIKRQQSATSNRIYTLRSPSNINEFPLN